MRITGAFVAATAILSGISSAQLVPSATPSSTSSISIDNSVTSFPTATATGEPCAVVNTLVSSFLAEPTNKGLTPFLPPSKALACLDAVPLDRARSSAFIDYLNPFLQFQSTLAYLKSPPTGYTLPGVDILGGLDEIKNNILAGKYTSQWAFEKDVNALINIMPKDFHLTLGPSLPLSNVFFFGTSLHLVSLSTDGINVPGVYVKTDLDAQYAAALAGTTLNWAVSAVVSIDGIPVSDYLQAISLFGNYQDPDALYNTLFYSPAQAQAKGGDGYAGSLNTFGLKDSSSFIFSNDTSTPKLFPNFAFVSANFSNINSGSDLFTRSVLPYTTTATSTTTAAIKARSLTTANPYPTNPIAQHPQGYMSGYYLNGYNDTCVLQMSAFEGSNTTDPNDSTEMQMTIQSTLSKCKAAGKTKLIVDLQGNGGGLVYNGFDAFKQLFPTLEPFGGSRVRATPAAHYFIDLFSEAGIYNSSASTVYQTQANVDVNGNEFSSPEVMFGPYQYYNDNFTAELRNNLSDMTQHSDLTITGYGDRSNPGPQPFTSDNIIMLMDGLCGSTCAIFAELMKTIGGVRSIAVGGRPQTGPMQYVAGSKGAQVYSYNNIQLLESFVPAANQSIVAQGKSAPALPSAEWIPSLDNPPLGPQLGAQQPNFNLRNAYKPNDPSQTPLQFIYEAANCRIFFTYGDIVSAESLWQRVYQTTWGNGTCVPGSTISSNNIISTLANATVPFNPSVVSNATNPFNGPGSLKPKSNSTVSGTPTPSGLPSATSSGPANVTANSGSSLKSSSVLFSAIFALLFALT